MPNKYPKLDAENMPQSSNKSAKDGTIMGQLKNAPAGAETPVTPGLTDEKDRLMTHRINTPDNTSRSTCTLFLELSRDDLEKAKRARNHYIGLAHKYGLSNVEIGAALGITEARVRAILAGA